MRHPQTERRPAFYRLASTLVTVILVVAMSGCVQRGVHPLRSLGMSRANGDEPTSQDSFYGLAVARHLQARYDDSQADCGGPTRPAILCSGILFRATRTSDAYHAWNPNPSNPKGAVSFSWIRHDAQFRSLYLVRYSHGFVMIPHFFADKGGRLDPYYKMEITCVYPIDAETDRRDLHGCGKYDAYPTTSVPCFDQGIDTAAKYVEHFRPEPRFAYSCSIPVGIGTPDSARNFTMFVDTIRGLDSGAFEEWNEVLVREWPQDIHTTIPLEAFFYQNGTPDGLAGAKHDQINFKKQSGKWVPIIRFNMPASIGDRATFQYFPSEQTP